MAYWDPDGRQKQTVGLVEATPKQGGVGGISKYQGPATVAYKVIRYIVNSARAHHDAQQRAFEALEVRAFNDFIMPVLESEIAAAHARGEIPTGDDVQMTTDPAGGDLFHTMRVSIAEALRNDDLANVEYHVHLLQVGIRKQFYFEGNYYLLGPHGEALAVPYARFPRVSDHDPRRAADGHLIGYGPHSFCTVSLDGASCTVR